MPAALVTGGLRDIGRATAAELAREGFSIAIGHRHPEAEKVASAEEPVRDAEPLPPF